MASTQHSWAITEQLGCAGFSLEGYMLAKILHNPSKSAAPLLWLTLPQVQAKTKTPTISGSSRNSSNSLKISIQPPISPINNHHQGSFLTILQQLDKSNQRPSVFPQASGLSTRQRHVVIHNALTICFHGHGMKFHGPGRWLWKFLRRIPCREKTKVEGFRTCLC